MIVFNFTFYSMICLVFLALFIKRENATARAGVIIFSILTVVWLWITLSFREPAGDPWRYMLGLNNIARLSFSELLDYDKSPFGFALFNWLTALISTNSILFFSLVYFLCLVPLYLAFRERVNKFDAASLMMLYLLYPYYINYLASGFKQGIAFGFMLWGLNCIIDNENPKWLKGIALLFTATLFHSSLWLANIVFLVWFFLYRRVSLSWSILTLVFTIILAATGMVESIVALILPESMISELGFDTYFDEDFISGSEFQSVGYQLGFRLDFTIFTVLPLMVIWYLQKKVKDFRLSIDMIKIYSIMASAYFLLVFIPYSDRIAGFSWFLMPFMMFTQISNLNSRQYKNILMLVFISLYPILMLDHMRVYFQ
ncbi:EpsG family protein [Psychrobacter maritimus]|uniref:EpsG family protein n=1 Tax=Psychrobacter maritimus TaxID=256325 RepID=UPI00248C2221|nr:EpsG family protein [Psychrobacter sp. WB2]WGV12259.1 EpsG family protein [Psychrobacter sp. WB2]